MNTFRAVFYDANGSPLHKGHYWFLLGRHGLEGDHWTAAEKLRYAADDRFQNLRPHEKIPEGAHYALLDDHGPVNTILQL